MDAVTTPSSYSFNCGDSRHTQADPQSNWPDQRHDTCRHMGDLHRTRSPRCCVWDRPGKMVMLPAFLHLKQLWKYLVRKELHSSTAQIHSLMSSTPDISSAYWSTSILRKGTHPCAVTFCARVGSILQLGDKIPGLTVPTHQTTTPTETYRNREFAFDAALPKLLLIPTLFTSLNRWSLSLRSVRYLEMLSKLSLKCIIIAMRHFLGNMLLYLSSFKITLYIPPFREWWVHSVPPKTTIYHGWCHLMSLQVHLRCKANTHRLLTSNSTCSCPLFFPFFLCRKVSSKLPSSVTKWM